MAGETISCHDCGASISFTAAACPACGSREPAGGYQLSAKECRALRSEERNDRNAIIGGLVGGGIGVAYALATSSSILATLFRGMAYGLLGMAVGVPLVFALSATGLIFPAKRPKRR